MSGTGLIPNDRDAPRWLRETLDLLDAIPPGLGEQAPDYAFPVPPEQEVSTND